TLLDNRFNAQGESSVTTALVAVKSPFFKLPQRFIRLWQGASNFHFLPLCGDILRAAMSPANGAVYKPPLRPRRFLLFAIIASSVGLLAGVALMEVVFRILERRENSHSVYEGSGGLWMEDGRWGWKPSLGAFRSVTSEFDVTGNINSLYMNDVS